MGEHSGNLRDNLSFEEKVSILTERILGVNLEEFFVASKPPSSLLYALNCAVSGDTETMKLYVKQLTPDEIEDAYRGVNVLMANLLARSAAYELDKENKRKAEKKLIK